MFGSETGREDLLIRSVRECVQRARVCDIELGVGPVRGALGSRAGIRPNARPFGVSVNVTETRPAIKVEREDTQVDSVVILHPYAVVPELPVG